MTTKEELKIYEVSNEMKKYFDKCFRKMLRGDWMKWIEMTLEDVITIYIIGFSMFIIGLLIGVII